MGVNMFRKIIEKMKDKNIVFDIGLTQTEVKSIEEIYHIKFPKSLRELIQYALPISEGFYNWRNMSAENIELIKSAMSLPYEEIRGNPQEVYWCEDWGERPKDEKQVQNIILEKLAKAPQLIPIYSHRYIPEKSGDNPTIFSVNGLDIIYYGKDLYNYLEIEFFNGKEIEDLSEFQSITFWSELL